MNAFCAEPSSVMQWPLQQLVSISSMGAKSTRSQARMNEIMKVAITVKTGHIHKIEPERRKKWELTPMKNSSEKLYTCEPVSERSGSSPLKINCTKIQVFGTPAEARNACRGSGCRTQVLWKNSAEHNATQVFCGAGTPEAKKKASCK